MIGTIKAFRKKTCTTRDGKNFFQLEIDVDIKPTENTIKTVHARLSMEYAKRYFTQAVKKTTAETVGKNCIVGTETGIYNTPDGTERKYTRVKYFYVCDDDGNAIRLPSDSDIDF